MNFRDIINTILQNQVVTGLSFTALLGAAAYQLRNIPSLIMRACLRFATVEMTVISTDISFDWLDRWLSHQPYAKRAKMLTLRAHDGSNANVFAPASEQHPAEWALSPGPGLHLFWWRRRPVFLERHFLSKEAMTEERRGRPVERLRFRTIGRSQRVVRRLITDVRDFSLASNTVSIRVWSDGFWTAISGKSRRPLDTIILREGQMERIVDDIAWFQSARQWYLQRGIPYRRAYLFSGQPGTGKTSLVFALAGHFNRPICMLNLGTVLDDAALVSAFHEAAQNAIILIEDVDCAFPAQSRENDNKETGRLTKAGLLNALDGIATPDGRVFVMTTNYPDRLDPALVRPGRADVHERFDYFNPTDQVRMAARFFPNQSFMPILAPVSPAALQAAFMVHPDDPRAAHQYLAQQSGD